MLKRGIVFAAILLGLWGIGAQAGDIRPTKDYLVLYHEAVEELKKFGLDLKPGVYLSPVKEVARRSDLTKLVGGGVWESNFSAFPKIEIAVGYASGAAGADTRGEIWAVFKGQYFLLEKKGVDQRVAVGVPRQIFPAAGGFFLTSAAHELLYISHSRKDKKAKKVFTAPIMHSKKEYQKYSALTYDGRGIVYLSKDLEVVVLREDGRSTVVETVDETERYGAEVAISGDGVFILSDDDAVSYIPLGPSGQVGRAKEVFRKKQSHEALVFSKNAPYLVSTQTRGGRVRYIINSNGELTETGVRAKSDRLTAEEVNQLRQQGSDLLERAQLGMFDDIVVRDEYLNRIYRSLLGRENTWVNLIGPVGIGKTSMLKALAKNVAERKGSESAWEGYEVFSMPISTLIRLEAQGKQNKSKNPQATTAFDETMENLRGKRLIIVIDDFLDDPSLGATNAKRAFDSFSNYFRKGIVAGRIRLITTSKSKEWDSLKVSNPAVSDWCTEIQVQSPSRKTLRSVLARQLDELQKRYELTFSPGVVDAIIDLSARAYPDRPEPKRSVLAAEEVARGYGLQEGHARSVTVAGTRRFFMSEVLGLGKFTKLDLDGLIKELDKKLVGQEEAKNKVIDELGALGIGPTNLNGPVATMFFVGPTGVGKSHTARLLADYLQVPSIHIDMTHFDSDFELKKKVDRYRNKPFILVLDEVDKASDPKGTLNKLRGIIDTGVYAEGTPNELNLRTAIVILIGNHGSEIILKAKPELSIEKLKAQLRQHVLDTQNTPLNEQIPRHVWSRIESSMVVFRKLEEEHLTKIAKEFSSQLAQDIKDTYEIRLHIDPAFIVGVVQGTLEEDMGAVPIKNRIRRDLRKSISGRLRRMGAKDPNRVKLVKDILIYQSKGGRVTLIDNTEQPQFGEAMKRLGLTGGNKPNAKK